MSWSSRRQLIIIFIVLVVIGGIVFLFLSPTIFKQATCFDFKQNGSEAGVDCGGDCQNLCSEQAKNPIVLWTRAFPVTESVYNAVAYIENQNDAGIEALPYEFRLYDERGIFVARVNGTALIPPQGRYAIVETGIQTGSATISTTNIQFSQSAEPWKRIPENIRALRVASSDTVMEGESSIPKLRAVLTNPSPTIGLYDISVSAILYDKDDNAINASKTFLPRLPAGGEANISFTWPRPLSVPVVRYDIIPVIDIFHEN